MRCRDFRVQEEEGLGSRVVWGLGFKGKSSEDTDSKVEGQQSCTMSLCIIAKTRTVILIGLFEGHGDRVSIRLAPTSHVVTPGTVNLLAN